MTRPRCLLITLAALTIAACGGGRPDTTNGTTHHGSTTGGGPDEQTVVALFAGSYVRFLDGAGTPAALPDAVPSVRALAGRAGPVPVSVRRGTLVLSHLRRARGPRNSYLLAARDDEHTFDAEITLQQQHGRWLVIQLTPPDFVQTLAPAGPPPPAPPRGSAAAETTARRFLAGYLPWLYGQAPVRIVRDATPGVLTDLKSQRPRIPLTMRSLHPRVVAIAMQRHGSAWQALPNITDGRETYELVLTIRRARGRWVVSNLSAPR